MLNCVSKVFFFIHFFQHSMFADFELINVPFFQALVAFFESFLAFKQEYFLRTKRKTNDDVKCTFRPSASVAGGDETDGLRARASHEISPLASREIHTFYCPP